MRSAIPFVLIGALVLVGCTYQNQPSYETPIPPTWLVSLPQLAQTSCRGGPGSSRGEVVVWELPGVEPSDANSAYMGERGQRQGSLPDCTEIMVTDFAWSKTDEEFWVHIETEGLEGWIPSHLVEYKQ